MIVQMRQCDSITNIRLLGTLRGGMRPEQRRVASEAMRVERAVNYADRGIRASRSATPGHGPQLSVTEFQLAEETPRLKGVVGWCPRSVRT